MLPMIRRLPFKIDDKTDKGHSIDRIIKINRCMELDNMYIMVCEETTNNKWVTMNGTINLGVLLWNQITPIKL